MLGDLQIVAVNVAYRALWGSQDLVRYESPLLVG